MFARSLIDIMGGWSTLCRRGAYIVFACVCTLCSEPCGRSRGDIPVESSIVHPPNVVISVDTNYGEMIALFLIFLSNVYMCRYNLLLL